MSSLISPGTAPAVRDARGPELVLANARIVLAQEVIRGAVALRDGRIAAVDPGPAVPRGALDCEGALLLPGLVELHTDNLERHLHPRPGVDWPRDAAVLAHDGELASCGITTVLDAVRVGTLRGRPGTVDASRYARAVADEVVRLRAEGALRIDHLLHVRAELCSHGVLEELDEFAGEPLVRMVSIMDHTPGQRQFADESKYRHYYVAKHGFSEAQMDAFVRYTKDLSAAHGAQHEAGVVARAQAMGAVLASHDDTTAAHVAHSLALPVTVAEFPTTLEAARAYAAAGVPVMMGAPNLLRGGSHSGNVAAADLARAGLLDILSSDYVPASLLMGALKLEELGIPLPEAVATVSRAPARAVGLDDRGEIAPGLRADLVMLRQTGRHRVVAGVWSAGHKVG